MTGTIRNIIEDWPCALGWSPHFPFYSSLASQSSWWLYLIIFVVVAYFF